MSKIVVDLDKAKICDEQITAQEEAIQACGEQTKILNEKVQLLDTKFNEAEKQIELNKKIADERDVARLKEIKEAKKPKWGSLFGALGLGALIALLL